MANQEHLDILKQGVKKWNKWRQQHPEIQPDLSHADLQQIDLSGANLSYTDLSYAELDNANLSKADLSRATLSYSYISGAHLSEAVLSGAMLFNTFIDGSDFSRANLSEADFSDASLCYANLINANLSRANFTRTKLVGSDFTNATLHGCNIYGISAWDIQLDGAEQSDLTITPEDQPPITVDNLKVAQFIYLILNNAEIRDVINILTTKAVLILGRFTPERKAVLDALRDKLRQHNYLPILFDFEKPTSRDFTETVRTLAHLARFIIADLTDPSSIPQELQAIVPTLAVPVQPVLLEGKREYAMFVDLPKTYHWVLPVHYYRDQANLQATLKEKVIKPAEQKAQELEKR